MVPDWIRARAAGSRTWGSASSRARVTRSPWRMRTTKGETREADHDALTVSIRYVVVGGGDIVAQQVHDTGCAWEFAAITLHQVVLNRSELKDIRVGFRSGRNAASQKATSPHIPKRAVLNYVARGGSFVIRRKSEREAFYVGETVAVEG